MKNNNEIEEKENSNLKKVIFYIPREYKNIIK